MLPFQNVVAINFCFQYGGKKKIWWNSFNFHFAMLVPAFVTSPLPPSGQKAQVKVVLCPSQGLCDCTKLFLECNEKLSPRPERKWKVSHVFDTSEMQHTQHRKESKDRMIYCQMNHHLLIVALLFSIFKCLNVCLFFFSIKHLKLKKLLTFLLCWLLKNQLQDFNLFSLETFLSIPHMTQQVMNPEEMAGGCPVRPLLDKHKTSLMGNKMMMKNHRHTRRRVQRNSSWASVQWWQTVVLDVCFRFSLAELRKVLCSNIWK